MTTRKQKSTLPPDWAGDRLLNGPEVRAALGIRSKTTLDALVREGRLRPIRVGARDKFRLSDINHFLKGAEG